MPAGWEWAVLVLIALLLFGGSRMAGIGRNAGRAVHEFKQAAAGQPETTTTVAVIDQPAEGSAPDIVDAELVEPNRTPPDGAAQA